MASTSRAPAAQTVLPEEIWEEIFLRLDAAADLTCASAACLSFHRIVSARRFLHRFRSLHSPAVLGFISRGAYGYRGYLSVGPPHRCAPDARALVQAADFTFSFLPDPHAWRCHHARDGRVLLGRRISTEAPFEDFLVCDPLHRRYVKIPRIPDDLIASAPRTLQLFPVLAPAGKNDDEESFRIICTVHFREKVVAFVFSSCNQTWQVIVSTIDLPNGYKFIEHKAYYAHGCLYWMFYGMGYSLMLDTSEMEFSVIDLPPHNFRSMRAIVEAEEGRLRFLAITVGDGTIDLYYCKNLQSNGVGAQEWQDDKLIPLLKDSRSYNGWAIVGTVGPYIALLGSRGNSCETQNSEYFVLDIKTLLLEKLCTSNNGPFYGFPYARFPPPLAQPSI